MNAAAKETLSGAPDELALQHGVERVIGRSTLHLLQTHDATKAHDGGRKLTDWDCRRLARDLLLSIGVHLRAAGHVDAGDAVERGKQEIKL